MVDRREPSPSDATPEPNDDPLALLERAVSREVERLERRHVELAEASEVLLRLRSQIQSMAFSPRFDVGIEPVAPGMVSGMVEHLHRRVRTVRSCTVSLEVGPGLDERNVRGGQEDLASGVVQRALYLDELLEQESGRQWVRNWAAAGEEQRVTTRRLSDFAVFGDEAVLAVSTWGDATSSHMFIRHPMLVAAFTALFDLAWDAAAPLTGTHYEASGDDRLLALMALGIKDEAMARHLGWSLRTVRRRVAGLMAEYGVDTRFQLGAAVARADRIR